MVEHFWEVNEKKKKTEMAEHLKYVALAIYIIKP